MPRPAVAKDPHIQFIGQEMPSEKKVGRSKEGKAKIMKAAAGVPTKLDRKKPSEKVAPGSMPGWVKKNIGHIETTEGRI